MIHFPVSRLLERKLLIHMIPCSGFIGYRAMYALRHAIIHLARRLGSPPRTMSSNSSTTKSPAKTTTGTRWSSLQCLVTSLLWTVLILLGALAFLETPYGAYQVFNDQAYFSGTKRREGAGNLQHLHTLAPLEKQHEAGVLHVDFFRDHYLTKKM